MKRTEAHAKEIVERKIRRSTWKADNPWQIIEKTNVWRVANGMKMLRGPRHLRGRYSGQMLRAIRRRVRNWKGELWR